MSVSLAFCSLQSHPTSNPPHHPTSPVRRTSLATFNTMILSRLLSGSPPKTVVMRTRNLRSMANCATVLRYGDYGDPLNVIERCEEPIPQPKDGEVLVKMLLASINPADINTIQGKYNYIATTQ